ncbi:hypothetical protein FJY71_08530, partial [candidate division WOR-3 bacterium]|nr:hypothetical protein [candidate division WOR-3 bacterium]
MRQAIAGLMAVAALAAGQVRPIRDVRQNNDQGEPLLNGQTVTVTGVVTVSIQFGPSIGPAYFQDGTGGVALFDSAAARLQIGDSVTVTGEVTLYNGLVELQDVSVQNHGQVGAPAARPMTLAEVGRIDTAAGYVENEGWLARLDSIQIDHNPGEVFQGNYNYDLTDPHGGTGLLRIDRDAAELVGMRIPDGYITITAVIGQYKTSAPYFGGYQLMPRLAEDLGMRVEVLTIAEVIADSNGDFVPDRLGDSVVVTGIVTAPSFSLEYTDIYVQDATAGVNVFDYDAQAVAAGDSVVVAGVIDQYNGKSELSSATVTRLAQGRRVPEPELVPFNRPLLERLEGRLLLVVGDVIQAPVRSG